MHSDNEEFLTDFAPRCHRICWNRCPQTHALAWTTCANVRLGPFNFSRPRFSLLNLLSLNLMLKCWTIEVRRQDDIHDMKHGLYHLVITIYLQSSKPNKRIQDLRRQSQLSKLYLSDLSPLPRIYSRLHMMNRQQAHSWVENMGFPFSMLTLPCSSQASQAYLDSSSIQCLSDKGASPSNVSDAFKKNHWETTGRNLKEFKNSALSAFFCHAANELSLFEQFFVGIERIGQPEVTSQARNVVPEWIQ